ncbi:hypothetical protein KW798_02885 [Candidatus Parcubacteria bacterium]|nr:hypothetical protein [Candidatus Parcubacteria bacterium]
MSYSLLVTLFGGTKIVASRKEEQLKPKLRCDAVKEVSSTISDTIRRIPIKFEKADVLVVNDERLPIWSWLIDANGSVINEQCEYAP